MTTTLLVKHLVGTAGWSIPKDAAARFKASGSALERYASVFSGVEINSSFYRRHRPSTWQRWHDATPEDFRFAVKLPKRITHELLLADVADELEIFLSDVRHLGNKLGPVLVQLPPSLTFDLERGTAFFALFRSIADIDIVLEPRHPSWASASASHVLGQFGVSRVYADPQHSALQTAAVADGFHYMRLHGSPKVYYSSYEAAALEQFRQALLVTREQSWCIFDNTASGAATRNALAWADDAVSGQSLTATSGID